MVAGESHEPQSNVFAAATNRMTTSTVAYDAAGNQTLYSPHTLAFDAENRLFSMTHASSGSGTYLYDGQGRRVKKTWTPGGGTAADTYYVYDIAGNLAAEYGTASNSNTPPPATLYPFTDMLGSVRAVTDAAGTVVECYDYLPFGRMLSSSDNSRSTSCHPADPDTAFDSDVSQKFTGQVRDEETRLDYFKARYMSAPQGRFLSPDPSRLSVFFTDPQSWNRYSYVYNQPFRFVDRNGAWPTKHHTTITGTAFRNVLSRSQIQRLIDSSNGQDTPLSIFNDFANFQHATSAWFRGPEKTRRLYEDFISQTLSDARKIQIEFWEQGSIGFSDAALDKFALALHAVQDNTSPAHEGFQLWFLFSPVRSAMHMLREREMTPARQRYAVDESRRIFNQVFGVQVYNASLVFDWIFAMSRNSSNPPPEGTVTVCFEGGSCF